MKQKLESVKEMARGIRNEMKREIDAKEGEPGVSEDDTKRWLGEMQEIYEEYIGKIEEMGEAKEKELMEI